MKNLSHEEITERAHKIWIGAGRPGGRDIEHWIQAENELRMEREYSDRASENGGNKKRTQSGRTGGK